MCRPQIQNYNTNKNDHQTFFTELRIQLRTSTPAIFSFLLYRIPWLVSLHFVGQIGSMELAAAALATTLCNVTGMSLSVGLNSAITTLSGQAKGRLRRLRNRNMMKRQMMMNYGSVGEMERGGDGDGVDDDHDDEENDARLLPITYLYRGVFIMLCLVIPMVIYWIHGVKPLLLALGQGDELSQMTEEYLRILAPGLLSYALNWSLVSWLQSIEMADVPAYAAFLGLVVHIPANSILINYLNFGYKGAAIATVLFQTVQPLSTYLYLWQTRDGRERLLKQGGYTPSHLSSLRHAIGSASGLLQYLSLALPGIVTVSEWWASELVIFWGGLLPNHPDVSLAAMSIYQSMNSLCFMFPVAASVGGSTRVGNLLGEGNGNGARLAAIVSVCHAGLWSFSCGLILWFVPRQVFPSMFTPEEDVIYETSRTIKLVAFYVAADGLQTALYGVAKGCGRQCVTMPIVVVAYWLVGLPLAYYWTFVREEEDGMFPEGGVVGLVAGMTVGTYVHFILLSIAIGCTNWDAQARIALERYGIDKKIGTAGDKISYIDDGADERKCLVNSDKTEKS